jgi:hypothetical protein
MVRVVLSGGRDWPACSGFLERLRVRGLSVHTLEAYAFDLALVHRWLEASALRLEDLTAQHVHTFLAWERGPGEPPSQHQSSAAHPAALLRGDHGATASRWGRPARPSAALAPGPRARRSGSGTLPCQPVEGQGSSDIARAAHRRAGPRAARASAAVPGHRHRPLHAPLRAPVTAEIGILPPPRRSARRLPPTLPRQAFKSTVRPASKRARYPGMLNTAWSPQAIPGQSTPIGVSTTSSAWRRVASHASGVRARRRGRRCLPGSRHPRPRGLGRHRQNARASSEGAGILRVALIAFVGTQMFIYCWHYADLPLRDPVFRTFRDRQAFGAETGF